MGRLCIPIVLREPCAISSRNLRAPLQFHFISNRYASLLDHLSGIHAGGRRKADLDTPAALIALLNPDILIGGQEEVT